VTSFPRQILKSVAIYHLPTAAGKQAYPGTPDATIEAAFLPLDRKEHALEGAGYVDPFELYTDPDADIRVTDRLVIDATTYYVKKIFDASYFGGHPHKRCSISSQP